MTIVRERWTNTTARFDYAIAGCPFFNGASADAPFIMKTGDWKRDQIDTAPVPGEASLSGDWLRAQASFHLGAGLNFLDVAADPQLSSRFADSAGVDVFTEGQVSLLPATELVYAATGKVKAIGYTVGGEDGVLVIDTSDVHKVTASGSVTNLNWGGGSNTAIDIATDGGAYYVLAVDGIYRGALPGATGVQIYEGSISRGTINYCKDRLIVTVGAKVYELAPAPSISGGPASFGTPLWTNPQDGFTWSDVAEMSGSIWLAGYAGMTSGLYEISLDTSGPVPVLSPPTLQTPLPLSETVVSLSSYMGGLLAVGTTKGFRVASVSPSESITLGPLLRSTDQAVWASCGDDDFIYFGGANVDGKVGLHRMSLRHVLQSTSSVSTYGSKFGSLLFPWAKDVASNIAFSSGAVCRTIVPVGLSGKIAFTVDGHGLVMTNPAQRAASGWLVTAKNRFDMAEDKVFNYLRVSTSTQAGHMAVEWSGDGSTWKDLYDWNTAGIGEVNTEASDQQPVQFLQYRFTLTRSTSNPAVSPVWTGYRVKAYPSGVKNQSIQLSLLCLSEESAPDRRKVNRPTWPRINKMFELDASSEVVVFQDFGRGIEQLVRVDSVQFVQSSIPENLSDRAQPGGRLIVNLVTVL